MYVRIFLEKLIIEAFEKFLNSEDYTRFIMLNAINVNSEHSFELDLELDNPFVYKVKLNCMRQPKYICALKYNHYWLDILQVEADMSFIYRDTRVEIDDCNASNNRHYSVNIVTDKEKNYTEKLEVSDSRLTYTFTKDMMEEIRKYDWTSTRRYSGTKIMFDKYQKMKSYGVLDLIPLRLLNMNAKEIAWLYENSSQDIKILIDSYDYHNENSQELSLQLLEEYINECKKVKRGNNNIVLWFSFKKSIYLNNRFLNILNELNVLFDEIHFVEDLQY